MKILPKQCALHFLYREARTLRNKHRNRDINVCPIIGHYETSFLGLSPAQILDEKFSIIDAQKVIARQYNFASWRRLKLFVEKSNNKTDAYNPELKKEILQRKEIRLSLIKERNIKKINEFTYASQEIIEKIYDTYGWPGPQVLGRDGTDALFDVGLGTILNSKFQNRSILLMESALSQGECMSLRYALTVDRALALSYKPTKFGCTWDFNTKTNRVELSDNVINKKNLNKRRAEIGLIDFKSANKLALESQPDTHNHSHTKETWQKYHHNCALEGGYITQ